ncbi:MAG: SulP family inorganic anion transporter [Caldilineales bacterium]|nr:SulP family inorganic anion transporter [Caldilineales bacterium]
MLLRREFSQYTLDTFQRDFLAALTVAAVALPLALAFGVASGADAAAGVVTAVIAGVVIGALGGAPYQISGPTGAMSAVLIVLAARYGLQAMWVAGLLAGGMLLLLGIFRLGRIVALIPAPVISGFTSGIAVLIALGQIDNALGISTPPSENAAAKLIAYVREGVSPNFYAVAVTLVVAAVMLLWPRFRRGHRLPGSLVGIVAATLMVVLTGWDVPTIGNIPRSILLENRLDLAAIPWGDFGALIVPAMSIAALGAIESLLCGAVAGNMTGIRLHNSVELAAQGIGNLIIPFFGGVPATAAIARTSVNVKSGGVTRLVSILHGVVLALIALLAAGIIGRVPLAALAGVLFVTAWRMNEWHAIHFYFGKRLKHAMLAFIVTLIATVLFDLTQAIILGFGISTLIFMSQMSDLHINRQPVDLARLAQNDPSFTLPTYPISVYYLSGPLFFAAARKVVEEVEALDQVNATLIFSMRGVPLIDATGVEALREIWRRQRKGGGNLLLSGLPTRAEALLRRSGFLQELGEQRLFWSADQAIRSLGMSLPQPAPEPAPLDTIDSTLVITPHEDRAVRGV